VRTGDDCKVSGSGVDYLNTCGGVSEGDDCGAPTVQSSIIHGNHRNEKRALDRAPFFTFACAARSNS